MSPSGTTLIVSRRQPISHRLPVAICQKTVQAAIIGVTNLFPYSRSLAVNLFRMHQFVLSSGVTLWRLHNNHSHGPLASEPGWLPPAIPEILVRQYLKILTGRAWLKICCAESSIHL